MGAVAEGFPAGVQPHLSSRDLLADLGGHLLEQLVVQAGHGPQQLTNGWMRSSSSSSKALATSVSWAA